MYSASHNWGDVIVVCTLVVFFGIRHCSGFAFRQLIGLQILPRLHQNVQVLLPKERLQLDLPWWYMIRVA